MNRLLPVLGMAIGLLLLGGCMTTGYRYNGGADYYYSEGPYASETSATIVYDGGYYGGYGYGDGYGGYGYGGYGFGYGYGGYGYGGYSAYIGGWDGFPWPLTITSFYYDSGCCWGGRFGGWYPFAGTYWADPLGFGPFGWNGGRWASFGLGYVPFYYYPSAHHHHQRNEHRRDLVALRAERARQSQLQGQRRSVSAGIPMWTSERTTRRIDDRRRDEAVRRTVLTERRSAPQPVRDRPDPPTRHERRVSTSQRTLPISRMHRPMRPTRSTPTRPIKHTRTRRSVTSPRGLPTRPSRPIRTSRENNRPRMPTRTFTRHSTPRRATPPVVHRSPRGMPAQRPSAPARPRVISTRSRHVAAPPHRTSQRPSSHAHRAPVIKPSRSKSDRRDPRRHQ